VRIVTGRGEKVERRQDDQRRFRVYMLAGDEERLRLAAKKVGILNQYKEGNISQILSMLAILDWDDLIDLLEELSELWGSWKEET